MTEAVMVAGNRGFSSSGYALYISRWSLRVVTLILVNRILMATGFRIAVVYTYSDEGGVSVEAEDECAVDFLKMRKVCIYERKKKVLTVRSLAKNGFFIRR